MMGAYDRKEIAHEMDFGRTTQRILLDLQFRQWVEGVGTLTPDDA